MPSAAPRRHLPSSDLAALGTILVLAACLRLLFIADNPLGYDELFTMELATGRGAVHLSTPHDRIVSPAPATTQTRDAPGFWRVWSEMDLAIHPPLYFTVLGIWRPALGDGAVAARSLSVVCSLMGIVFLFLIAKRLFGRGPALWAALLMALASPQIQYAQQARNYSFSLMVALTAGWALVKVERDGASPQRIALLAIALMVTALTHYFSLGVLLALFAYAMIRLDRTQRWRTFAAFAVAAVLFLAAWGPFLLEHAREFADGAEVAFLLWRDAPLIKLLVSVPVRMLVEPLSLTGWVLAPGVFLLVPWYLFLRPGRGAPSKSLLLFPTLWLIVSIGFIALLDLSRGSSLLAHVRYIFFAGPGACLLVATLFWRERGWGRHVLPALAAIACLLAMLDPQGKAARSPYLSEEVDWKPLAFAVDERTAADDVLIFYDDSPGGSGDPFLQWSHHSSSPASHPIVLLDGPAPMELLDQLKGRPRVWMVYGSTKLAPEQLLPGFRTTARIDLSGVPVRLYALSP